MDASRETRSDDGGPTPGPWYVFTQRERSPYQDHDDETTHEHHYVMKARGVTIAAVNTTCLLYQNGAADARLIAAAPDLLETLMAVDDHAHGQGWDTCCTALMTRVHAAIRKATAPTDGDGVSPSEAR